MPREQSSFGTYEREAQQRDPVAAPQSRMDALAPSQADRTPAASNTGATSSRLPAEYASTSSLCSAASPWNCAPSAPR